MVCRMQTPDDLLTVPQVSVILGKSVRTIHRLVAADRIRVAHRLPGPNGAILIRRADAEALRAASEPVRSAS